MKSVFFLAAFTAIAAAAPRSDVDFLIKRASTSNTGKRCGGGSSIKCAIRSEKCVGEYYFNDDPKGVCIKEPSICGDTKETPGIKCGEGYKCALRANENECYMGWSDITTCGYCVENAFMDKVGGSRDDGYRAGTNRCGGPSGKKCFNNPYSPEICVGEKEMKDGLGICSPKWRTRGCEKGCTEFARMAKPGSKPVTGDICVGWTKKCYSDEPTEDCGGTVCLTGRYIDQFGLKKKPTSTSKPPTTTSAPKSSTTKPTKPTIPTAEDDGY
ncbi:hypothetical protein ABW20_dc0110348 [Dactylellina cionopaga]|nr:hypothetical protein ABW20_dc0110348 [Dactylellina cionopaga]